MRFRYSHSVSWNIIIIIITTITSHQGLLYLTIIITTTTITLTIILSGESCASSILPPTPLSHLSCAPAHISQVLNMQMIRWWYDDTIIFHMIRLWSCRPSELRPPVSQETRCWRFRGPLTVPTTSWRLLMWRFDDAVEVATEVWPPVFPPPLNCAKCQCCLQGGC